MILRICTFAVLIFLLAGVCLADQKPVTDDMITNQVMLKLAGDPDVKGGGLKVDVKNGVVTLSGTVELEKQREKATRLAKKVKGVKQVINNIVLRDRNTGK